MLTAAVIAISPSISGEFLNWDDDRFVVDNRDVDSFNLENIQNAFGEIRFESYQPLPLVSYMIDASLWPKDARLYRVHNLVVFLISLVLLYELFARLGFSSIPAGLACLFFALAPYRVESVAWIAARKDVLALLFSLLSWHFHLSAGGNPRRRVAYLALAALFMVAALLSKSAALVVPFMILAGDIGFRGFTFRRALLMSAVYLPLVAAVAVFVPIIWSNSALVREPVVEGWWGRIILVAWSFNHYLRTALWPFGLSPLYAEPSTQALNTGALGGLGAVVGIAGALGIARMKKLLAAGPLVALVWFAVGMAPFMNAIPMYYLVADRYLLFGSLGLALAAALFCRWYLSLKRRRYRLMLIAGMLAIAISWGVAAREESRAWTTSKTLWSHAVKREPNSFFARLKLGETLMDAGDYEEASSQYREARRIRPLSPSALGGLFSAAIRLDGADGKLDESKADKMVRYFVSIANDGPKLSKFRVYLKKRGFNRAAKVVSSRLE